MRWGVIGVGDDTQVQIGPAFRRIAGSELVAVVRGTAALAKRVPLSPSSTAVVYRC